MSFKVEDHYDLRKHLHVDHNMIFYEEQKSSCDECHSKLKTTTTWENTFTLTITFKIGLSLFDFKQLLVDIGIIVHCGFQVAPLSTRSDKTQSELKSPQGAVA